MTSNGFEGYDIIGDIHGCAAPLEALLDMMGYRRSDDDGPHRHPNRQAIFVGDLIDRGPQQLLVLQIVRAMVEAGSAQMVLGNHEFNAMAYGTEWPDGSGRYLRPHDEPENERAAKNEDQHRAFLEQVTGGHRIEFLDWMAQQPLWLDLGGIRVVHACWHQPSIDYLTDELGGTRLTTVEQLVRASTDGDPMFVTVETLLKGPEISLTAHGLEPYLDKDGHSRDQARMRWWNSEASTLRDIAEMGANFTITKDVPYPPLPEVAVPVEHRSHVYADEVPVFYGHYWRQGTPKHQDDWTDYTACVYFSAVKGGRLTAYRWSGEQRIAPENYVSVAATQIA